MKTQRCKVCLKTSATLKNCSSCKSVAYCSTECQRFDWRDGGHRNDCRTLKEELSKLHTAFGSVAPPEMVARLLHRGGGGNNGDLISKVVLPSAEVAKEMLAVRKRRRRRANEDHDDDDDEDVDKDITGDDHVDVINIVEKNNDCFIDVLAYYLEPRSKTETDVENDDDDYKVERTKNLNKNAADGFFLDVVAECHARQLNFAIDKSAQDYLTVVTANLDAARQVMKEVDSDTTMDRLELLFYALHWMKAQALVVAGRAKLVLTDFAAAEIYFASALSGLDCMESTSFSHEADKRQIDAIRQRIDQLRREMPQPRLTALTAQWEAMTNEANGTPEEEKKNGPESAMILRQMGLLKMQMGDIDAGRKNLVKSLNQLIKFHNSVKEYLRPDLDHSHFLTCLGEAYELCAIFAMPGEAAKSGKDVVKMQRKASEMFQLSANRNMMLRANIRLWNWHRNGRVFTRWSNWMRKNKHEQFHSRLEEASNSFMDDILTEIKLLETELGLALDHQCHLCNQRLSWHDVDDDPLEILIHCKHAYHATCLDLYLEGHERACPTCQVVFAD